MESVTHIVMSSITALLSVGAVWCAWFAMKRGLTYSAMSAVVIAMVFLSLSLIWHLFYEIYPPIERSLGEAAEFPEYILHIAASLMFIWLGYKAAKIKSSHKHNSHNHNSHNS